jgi:hypothetical protein
MHNRGQTAEDKVDLSLWRVTTDTLQKASWRRANHLISLS